MISAEEYQREKLEMDAALSALQDLPQQESFNAGAYITELRILWPFMEADVEWQALQAMLEQPT